MVHLSKTTELEEGVNKSNEFLEEFRRKYNTSIQTISNKTPKLSIHCAVINVQELELRIQINQISHSPAESCWNTHYERMISGDGSFAHCGGILSKIENLIKPRTDYLIQTTSGRPIFDDENSEYSGLIRISRKTLDPSNLPLVANTFKELDNLLDTWSIPEPNFED